MMDDFARYILAIAKLSQDEDTVVAVIKAKLNELVDAQRAAVVEALDAKSKTWGDVSRRVNTVVAELKVDIASRKIT
jgi:hypothetical protein